MLYTLPTYATMHTFKPNCSLPLESAAFVSAPNVRGTLGIVWPCISTILLCTWSIQHLNVPEPRVAKTWPQVFARKFYTVGRQIVWMIVTLIAPEYLVGVAFSELLAVMRAKKHVKAFADEDGVEWTTEHTYLANMGGLVLVFGQPEMVFPALFAKGPAAVMEGVDAPPVAKDYQRGSIAWTGFLLRSWGQQLLVDLLHQPTAQPAAVDGKANPFRWIHSRTDDIQTLQTTRRIHGMEWKPRGRSGRPAVAVRAHGSHILPIK
jgi:hypothetical protein